MTTAIDISKKIVKAIKKSGMKQMDLAKKLGVNQSMISHYLSGRRMPALDTLSRLCSVLDLDANEILCVQREKDY